MGKKYIVYEVEDKKEKSGGGGSLFTLIFFIPGLLNRLANTLQNILVFELQKTVFKKIISYVLQVIGYIFICIYLLIKFFVIELILLLAVNFIITVSNSESNFLYYSAIFLQLQHFIAPSDLHYIKPEYLIYTPYIILSVFFPIIRIISDKPSCKDLFNYKPTNIKNKTLLKIYTKFHRFLMIFLYPSKEANDSHTNKDFLFRKTFLIVFIIISSILLFFYRNNQVIVLY